jgi:hypothetical protein
MAERTHTREDEEPLQSVIHKLEQIRDACYVCDRLPLDDMISDLRRWSAALAPEKPELEVSTVRERAASPAASASRQLKTRTG